MAIELTYDATTDATYLRLRPTGPDDVIGPALFLEHDPAFPDHVTADFTLADGVLVGLEVSLASRCPPAELLASAERIDGEHLARRFGERIGRLLAAGDNRSRRRKSRDVAH